MDLSSSGFIAYAGTEATRKKLRYASVSVAFLPIGQGLLQFLGPWLDDYVAASLLAASIATIPNFFANKHFVWRVNSRKHLHKQVLVFWVAVMLGVSLATLFTYLVEKNVIAGQTTLVRGTTVLSAQLLGFGIVWVGRFFILDRWLFKRTTCPSGPTWSSAKFRPDRSNLSKTCDKSAPMPGLHPCSGDHSQESAISSALGCGFSAALSADSPGPGPGSPPGDQSGLRA
jgi:putative flippase GtrA